MLVPIESPYATSC